MGLLARRFLGAKHADGFVSFIAWVSVAGVAVGVLALTVVTSVVNGFEGELTRVITSMNSEVILYSRGEPIAQADAVEQKIRQLVPETTHVTRSFIAEVMLSGPNGVAGAALDGFDPATIGGATQIPQRVVAGSLPSDADAEMGAPTIPIALGATLAERLGVEPGAELRLILPFAGEGEAGLGQPKAVPARVVGVVKLGMHDYDSKWIFAPLRSVQALTGQAGKVTSFKIRLRSGADSAEAAVRLGDSFGYPFRAKDWAQLNKNLFYAIRLEKVVIAILLTAIILVAAFNVVSTLMMMIHDKTKELAILKAMGLRPAQGFHLFCGVGLGMGLVGTAAGVGLGLGLNELLARTQLIQLPAEVYSIGYLPVVVRWPEIGSIAVLSILISFGATLYPAWKVARQSPLEGLRHDR